MSTLRRTSRDIGEPDDREDYLPIVEDRQWARAVSLETAEAMYEDYVMQEPTC